MAVKTGNVTEETASPVEAKKKTVAVRNTGPITSLEGIPVTYFLQWGPPFSSHHIPRHHRVLNSSGDVSIDQIQVLMVQSHPHIPTLNPVLGTKPSAHKFESKLQNQAVSRNIPFYSF